MELTIPDRPNVVYILTDQWRAKATGYNGDPNAITPDIDRLAAESIDFANAIGTSPVCTPARAVLLTGRYPTTTGMFMNDISLSPNEESIGKVFKKGGYETAYIGNGTWTGMVAPVISHPSEGKVLIIGRFWSALTIIRILNITPAMIPVSRYGQDTMLLPRQMMPAPTSAGTRKSRSSSFSH